MDWFVWALFSAAIPSWPRAAPPMMTIRMLSSCYSCSADRSEPKSRP